MNNRIYVIVFLLLSGISFSLQAQTNFYLSGLGRALVTNDKLKGDILTNDTTSQRRGAGGYTLFDLKANLDVNTNFHANAILRVRNEFGIFWGLGTAFNFRQLQLIGTINNKVKYEIGDINIGMTPYTVYNPDEIYHKYEADVFAIRRGILEYENFNFGNLWRLQGVQLSSTYLYSKGIQKLSMKGFGVRTNATNEINIPDRVLAGLGLDIIQSKLLSVGLNYVGMLDIPIETSQVNYQNEVFTGKLKLNHETENLKIELGGETGISNYNYSHEFTVKESSSYNDFFYDVALSGTYKPVNLKLSAGYKDVGPQFSSPAAQTRRINVLTTPALFGTLGNDPFTFQRQQILFDRLTQEGVYNRAISPVLMPFLPQYNNISPYGPATPNRRGMTFGASTDLPNKFISAEVIADIQQEIVGEGNADLRKFMGIRGGLQVNFDKILKAEKALKLNAGIRNEQTTRTGTAPISFNSTLIDGGITWEFVKKIDLLVGVKKLYAKGNEFLYFRDEFNTPMTGTPILLNLNSEENIYSLGARMRFSENSFFTLSYNLSQFRDKDNSLLNYDISQVFANYTIQF